MPGRTRPFHWPRAIAVAVLALFSVASLACRGGERSARPTPHPVVLIGIDGLEWRVVLELVGEGRMPVMADLMREGTFGYLETLKRPVSPVVWTSVATGKRSRKHGILGFTKQQRGRPRLYTNRDRRTKALWNILSDFGRSVHSVGWWITFPAEPIQGTMVAQTNTTAQIRPGGARAPWKGTIVPGLEGQVTPVEFQSRVIGTALEVEESLAETTRDVFGELGTLSEGSAWQWEQSQWAFRADTTYLRVTQELLREERPDLLMVYFGAPDVVGHRFWRHAYPGEFATPPADEEIAALGNVLADSYAWADSAVGALLEAYDDDPTVLVVSDHGMRGVSPEKDFEADPRGYSGHHPGGLSGVLIASGPSVRRAPAFDPASAGAPGARTANLPILGRVFDITPTILALHGLPIGKDMDGSVLDEVLEEGFLERSPPSFVDTHDTERWLENRPQQLLSRGAEKERLDQLRALGYIE